MSIFSQKSEWREWFRSRNALNVDSSFDCLESSNYEQEEVQFDEATDSLSSTNNNTTLKCSRPILYLFRISALVIIISFVIVFISSLTPSSSANLNSKYPYRNSENTHKENFDASCTTFPKDNSSDVQNEDLHSDSTIISPTEETDNISTPQDLFGIPQSMYLHFDANDTSSKFYWVPKILEQKESEDDVTIDLSNFIDPNLAYTLTDSEKKLVSLVVQRESDDEPFLGQVLVAEDLINRFRTGIYGPDKIAILTKWYGIKVDSSGNYHVYSGSAEVLEYSDSVQKAVDLVLDGCNISYFLLKAVTDFRNEQYGLTLGDIYYKNGALYHFSPKYLNANAFQSRTFNRIPVSFWYGNHIFYGYWLPKSQALQIF